MDDITALVSTIAGDIVSRFQKVNNDPVLCLEVFVRGLSVWIGTGICRIVIYGKVGKRNLMSCMFIYFCHFWTLFCGILSFGV